MSSRLPNVFSFVSLKGGWGAFGTSLFIKNVLLTSEMTIILNLITGDLNNSQITSSLYETRTESNFPRGTTVTRDQRSTERE